MAALTAVPHGGIGTELRERVCIRKSKGEKIAEISEALVISL